MIVAKGKDRVSKIDTYLNCAEANALMNCSREQTIGADLYLTSVNPEDASIHRANPCPLCARMIIQAGIRNVYLRQGNEPDDYIVLPADELKWCL